MGSVWFSILELMRFLAVGAAGRATPYYAPYPAIQKSRLMQQNEGADPIALFCCVSLLHNKDMIYGYARVSTDGQSVAAQIAQLTGAGAEKVFREVACGAKTDRAQLARALAQLDADDVLLVTRLDRLARSTRILLNTLATITDRKAGFRSLGDT
jgi:hypothetical protein